MSIYREHRRINRFGVGLALALLILFFTVVWLFFYYTRTGNSSDPQTIARAKILEAAEGLEIFGTEYSQAGQGAELVGARGALSRARAAFESVRKDLDQIDMTVITKIADDFDHLEAKVANSAPATEVLALAEAIRKSLLMLVGSVSNAPSSQKDRIGL